MHYKPLMAVPQRLCANIFVHTYKYTCVYIHLFICVCVSVNAKRFSNLPFLFLILRFLLVLHHYTHIIYEHIHINTHIYYFRPRGPFWFRQRCERDSFVGLAYMRFSAFLRQPLLSHVNSPDHPSCFCFHDLGTMSITLLAKIDSRFRTLVPHGNPNVCNLSQDSVFR